MRKLSLPVLLTLFIFNLHAQVKFDALTFSPQFPKPGQPLSFQFDANNSVLKNEKEVAIAVYLFSKKGWQVQEPGIIHRNDQYSGTVQTDSSINCIAFVFSGNDQTENNSGKGFIIPVYNEKNQPLQEYYLSANQLYSGMGEYLGAASTDPVKGLSVLEEGFAVYPEAKEDGIYTSYYLAALGTAKRSDAETAILDQLKTLGNKSVLKEYEYGILTQWYEKLKRNSTADSFTAVMKKQYPEGEWKKAGAMGNFYAESDPEKKKKILDEYIAAYPPKKEEDNEMLQNYKAQVAEAYANKKNYAAFKKIAVGLPPSMKYSFYNNLAWEMSESKENPKEALAMAKEATEWAKNEIDKPTGKKSMQLTQKGWEQSRKSEYATYADTYAFVLYNAGAYKQGLPFAKDAATINKLQEPELNERYALLLEKAAPVAEAKKIIEQMVSSGKASAKTKQALKNIYVKEKANAAGFDVYLAKLESVAKEKKKEEVTKSMINEQAPKFTLKDFQGKEVSLESLKGKVIVIDFWATWCGPCIASMPGMKTATEKMQARSDVQFLFIDTWENVADKKQNAMDFMKKKDYPFYVLLDDDNKAAEDFNVKGIPAKFVIDKTGNIRFKATGFSGNADELADEISLMIDLASK